jgi:creatinine amidohydrolase
VFLIYSKVIEDMITSLQQSSNFTHFYFINGHGGNITPFTFAQETIQYKRAILQRKGIASKPLKIKCTSWFKQGIFL